MNNLHHIAIVVESIEKSLEWFCRVYNGEPLYGVYNDENQLVKAQFIQTPFQKIELLEPMNEKSPIRKFLNKHGSGSIYHLAFEIEDFETQEALVKQKGGIIVSKSSDAWNGMTVMFAMFFHNNESQLVEYVKQ